MPKNILQHFFSHFKRETNNLLIGMRLVYIPDILVSELSISSSESNRGIMIYIEVIDLP